MYIVEKKYIFPNKQSLQDEQLKEKFVLFFNFVKFIIRSSSKKKKKRKNIFSKISPKGSC